MLILERQVRENLKLLLPSGGIIDVKIIGITGNMARVGITAPRDVKVYREEVWNKLVRDMDRAALAKM
jgi:carbon storage regulator